MIKMKYYKLNNCDIEECQESERKYWRGKNLFRNHIDGYFISTIFLCDDCNINNIQYGANEPPVLFETMVFDQDGSIMQTKDFLEFERFATYKDAAEYHNKRVCDIYNKTRGGTR